MSLGLNGDSLPHRINGIDVLDFGFRAQLFAAHQAHRNIRIAAQMAFFHIGFRHPYPAQQLAQLSQVLGGLIRGAQVWFGDHLHQRHAAAVVVQQTHTGFMFGLAGIFLKMQPVDAHMARSAIGQFEVHIPPLADGFIKLGDLVALGQVGVKIILTIKYRTLVDLRVHGRRQPGTLQHGFLVENGQYAW